MVFKFLVLSTRIYPFVPLIKNASEFEHFELAWTIDSARAKISPKIGWKNENRNVLCPILRSFQQSRNSIRQ